MPYRNILIKYRVQEMINSLNVCCKLMSALIRQLITGIYQSLFKTWRADKGHVLLHVWQQGLKG